MFWVKLPHIPIHIIISLEYPLIRGHFLTFFVIYIPKVLTDISTFLIFYLYQGHMRKNCVIVDQPKPFYCRSLLLCQLTCQSADIMASLCGVRVHVNNFSKTTRPRDMLFFLKIPYLLRMKNCSRHANLSVRLFARAITREVPPPKV